MSVNIAHRTTFTTSSNIGPQSITIPATTAGNTIVVLAMVDFPQNSGTPKMNGVPLNHPNGQGGAGISYLENIAGGITSLDYSNGAAVPAAAVVYELTPCTRDASAGVYTPANGQKAVVSGANEVGVTINSAANAAYFEVLAQTAVAGSVNSVSAGWTLDYTTGPFGTSGQGMGGVAYILNTSGSKTPTFSVTNPGATGGICGISFLDSGPTPPACTVKDSGGNTLSTYISSLGLSIAPATELFTNYIDPGNVTASQYTTEGRVSIVLDFNAGDGLYARDIEAAFTWSLSNRLALRVWQPSLIAMPEEVFNRPTDWDDGGTPGNKFVQGITIEADSFGLQKTFQLQSADDLSLHTLNEVPATFPKQTIKTFSCVTPFLAHSTRILSTDGVSWRVWRSSIIFQPWPSQVTNWQTEQTSFGMVGWLHAREMNVGYAAAQAITIVLVPDNGPTVTLTLPSTGGALIQMKAKLTLPPMKFKLLSVQVVSTGPFYLFETDLEFKIKQWGSTDPYSVLKVIGGPSRPGAEV